MLHKKQEPSGGMQSWNLPAKVSITGHFGPI